MLKFRNNLDANLNCFFGKERFLVWKESQNTFLETTEQENTLRENLNLKLQEFRKYILDEIHPQLARIIQAVKNRIPKNLSTENQISKKNSILKEIGVVEQIIHLEIPKEIPANLSTEEEQKKFFLETIKEDCYETVNTPNNSFCSIFYNLEQLDPSGFYENDLYDLYKTEISPTLNRLIQYSQKCKSIFSAENIDFDSLSILDKPIKKSDPITQETEKNLDLLKSILKKEIWIEESDVIALNEKKEYLSKQLDKTTINPEIKKEIEEVIAKVDNVFEQIKIRELCLAVNEIDFYQTEDLSHLKKEEIETLIEVIHLYYNQAEKVLFVLTSEEKSLFLKNLKHVHKLTEAQEQTDTNSVNIPMTISNLIQTMRNNPVFSN